MGALSLRLPESLHRKLGEVAAREGVSINQLISSAVAEKMSALMTEEYLDARAKRASRRVSRQECERRSFLSLRDPAGASHTARPPTVFPRRRIVRVT